MHMEAFQRSNDRFFLVNMKTNSSRLARIAMLMSMLFAMLNGKGCMI